MKASTFKLLGGCAVVAMLALIATQRVAISNTRAANEVLRRQSVVATAVVGAQAFRVPKEESVALKEANRDLPKLRNEVRRLREEKRELERLRSENEELAAQLKVLPQAKSVPLSEAEGFVLREKWSNAGFATPESTVQTFFWAITQRNAKRLAECMPDNDARRAERDLREDESFRDLANMRGFRIAEKKQLSDDKVELSIQAAAGGRVLPMPLRLINGEWKLSD